jgi:hypothetical protein
MSDIIDQLRVRLPRWGWAIVEEGTFRGESGWAYGYAFSLLSDAPPAGRRIRLAFRDDYWEGYWDNTGDVTVHPVEPAWFSPVTLPAPWAGRDDFRQLRRVLRWFHDPGPAVFRGERNSPGDWYPPEDWLSAAPAGVVGLEHRWPFCTDPDEMLRYVGNSPGERKLRLLGCALARQLPAVKEYGHDRHVVALAEQHAEGLCPRRELKRAARGSALRWLLDGDPSRVVALALEALRWDARANAVAADLIREIVGNPFVPVSVRYVWLRLDGGAVRHLADAIAASADFALMPVLADALEDAGCTEPRALEHARHGGAHVRGCWLLDALRGVR